MAASTSCVATLAKPSTATSEFTDPNTTWDEHAPYFRRGFAAQVEDLVAAIENGRPPTIDGHDGLAAVAMATGAIRSWREDSVVRL